MKSTSLPGSLAAIAALALSSLTAQADSLLLDYNLGGTQVDLVTENLSNTAGFVNNAGVHTLTLGSGSIVVGDGGYPAGMGLYKWMGTAPAPYDLTVTNNFGTGYSANSVVFQFQIGPNPDYDVIVPTLSFNGGNQELAPIFGGQATDFTSIWVDAIGDTADLAVYAWQWDLSYFTGDITSISINTGVVIHTSTSALGLHVSDAVHADAIVQVVPEPSTYALIAAGTVGAYFMRRRRKTA